MKNYLKILIITFVIQLVAYALSCIQYKIYSRSSVINDIGNAIIVIGVLVSIIVDIVLAIKWGSTVKQKLVYILLMPTNYIWLGYVLWVFWYIGQWIDMIEHIHN